MPDHINRRYQTWYAELAVPPDVRSYFGKRRFVQSLKTRNRGEALRRAGPIIAQWKRMIEEARGRPPQHEIEAILMQEALAKAETPAARNAVLDEIDTMATFIRGTGSNEMPDPSDLAAAEDFYAVATGAKVATDANVDRWLSNLENTQKTLDLKRSEIQRLVERFPTLDSITRRGLQTFVEELVASGLARATVQRCLSTWRNYWRYNQQIEVVPDEYEPFARVSLPKVSARKQAELARKDFSVEDIHRLYAAAAERDDAFLADLIRLAALTGARIEELCSLKPGNIHLNGPVPYLEIVAGKTAAAARKVPLHHSLVDQMKRMVANAKKEGREYLIESSAGSKYGTRSASLSKRFGRLRSRLGFEKAYVFHSLRRSFITLLELAQVPELTIRDIVGHSRATVTSRYSGGTTLEVRQEAIEKLDLNDL